MKHLSNFIAGSYDRHGPKSYSEVVNPVNAEVIAYAPISTYDDARRATVSASVAFEKTRLTTPSERARLLLRIAAALDEDRAELARLESENTGQSIKYVDAIIDEAIDHVTFFAGAARNLDGLAAGEYMRQHTSMLRREPIGVCVGITPWNFPLLMAIWKLAPALAAGNTVVLKPAESTPLSTLRFAEQISELVPPGAVNVICGDALAGQALVQDDIPAMISLTGSVEAGIRVAEAAARGMKHIHLELGGKAPVIIFDDVRPDVVARNLAKAAVSNAGQDCMAPTRLLVPPTGFAQELAQCLVDEMSILTPGPPTDATSKFGPLNNATQLTRVQSFIDLANKEAELLTGGKRVDNLRGYFVEPTVISNLSQTSDLIQKEIFGPVVSLQHFNDEEDAIQMANGVQYGLASSIWTRDIGRANRVASQLDCGTVWINTHKPLVAEMPHGGYKFSGTGADLSMFAFNAYTRVKHVMVDNSFEG